MRYLILLILGSFHLVAQHSNVTISTGATSNGVWTLVGSVITFTPTADNANVNYYDIAYSKMSYGVSAIINTACASCTQAGTITTQIYLYNHTYSPGPRTLTFQAGSDVIINQEVSMAGPGTNQYGTGIQIVSGGNVQVKGDLVTQAVASYNGTPSISPNISIQAAGYVSLSAGKRICTSGAYNVSSETYAYGGSAGSITIQGDGGINLAGTLEALGGENPKGFSFVGRKNDVNLSTNASTITSNGSNDGQVTGSLIKCNILTKSGTGVFQLTNGLDVSLRIILQNGIVRLAGSNNVLRDGGYVSIGNNAVLELGNYTETTGPIEGQGLIRNAGNGLAILELKYDYPWNWPWPETYTYRFKGQIQDGNGTVQITKSGSGIWVLEGSNTFSGACLVQGGELGITNSNALGSAAMGTVVSDNAYLSIDGSISVENESLTLNSKGLGSMGALTMKSGNSSWSGPLTIYSAGTRIAVLTGSLTCNGSLNMGGNLSTYIQGIKLRLAGIVSGTGGITKEQSGDLELAGANTFSGNLIVSAGRVILENSQAMGLASTGNQVLSGASLLLKGGITVAGESLTMAGETASGQGALGNVSGNNAFLGTLTMTTLTRINALSGELQVGDLPMGVNGLNMGSTGDAGSIRVSGVISGTGYVQKMGAGTLRFDGLSTYSGATYLNEGTIQLEQSNAFPSGSLLQMYGGTFFLNGYSQTINQLNVNDNSNLRFGSGVHQCTLGSIGSYVAGKILLVKDWSGDYSIPGSGQSPSLEDSGLIQTSSSRFINRNGQLKSVMGLNEYGQIRRTGFSGTGGQLIMHSFAYSNQIKFLRASDSRQFYSIQLTSKEVVPDYSR